MHNQKPQIQPLNLRTASEHEYCALNTFENELRAEIVPEDPPVPLAEEIQRWQNIPGYVDVCRWLVWHAHHSTVVASASAEVWRIETNQHLLEFNIEVLPVYRGQGLARRLLRQIVKVAQREQRRLWLTHTSDRIPAGAAFMQRLGANQGLAAHINQLDLATLDGNLIDRWQARAGEYSAGFELRFWSGPCPEEYVEAVAALHTVGMNQQPHDQLDIEDFNMTPERVRQHEQYFTAIGSELWSLIVCEQATGKLVGLTHVWWNANRPAIVQQGWTVVLPEVRNRGLGRWLKAAMLKRVLRERPQVKYVRTGNADSNAVMLTINHELGFKPYISHCVWQVETAQVAAYLNGVAN